MDQVSEIIRKYRESKGWNKSQLARQLGISSQLLGQYETGKRLPKANFILKWKEVTEQDLLKQNEANVSRETHAATNVDEPDLRIAIRELSEANNRHSVVDDRNSRIIEELIGMLKLKMPGEQLRAKKKAE